MSDKLILLKRLSPIEYEVHRGRVNQDKNLIITTRDKDFAERLVYGHNDRLR